MCCFGPQRVYFDSSSSAAAVAVAAISWNTASGKWSLGRGFSFFI
jgi:hypothetical protein